MLGVEMCVYSLLLSFTCYEDLSRFIEMQML